MKKLLLSVFFLLGIIANCFAQQYVTTTFNNGNYIPFGGGATWGNYRCQYLYVPGDFAPAPPVGFITKIYWRAAATQTGSIYNSFQIDMGQNSMTTFTAGPWVSGLTTVHTAAAEVINTTTGSWVGVTLQTPFFFDPTQSLVIDTRQTSTTGAGFTIYYGANVGNKRAYNPSPTATCATDANRYDFGFDLIQGFPCTGAPTTTLTGPDQVCPNRNFTISFGTFYTGVTRQWQKSTDGVTWTNFTGTVNVNTGAITDAITVNTYYRCILTCIATSQSFTTIPKLVKIAPFYYCYCVTNGTSTGADVGNVTVNALPSNAVLLNNGTAAPIENNPLATKTYSYFSETLQPVPMYRDSLYKFTVSQTNSAAFVASMTAIYIDMNRNGTFDDSERITKQPSVNVLPTPGVVTLPSFTLPTWAEYGLTGMRVITKAGTGDPDTCGNYTNGESEDYLVDLRLLPCKGKPNPGVIVGDTSMCNGYKYVLTDTTVQDDRHGIDRFWQLSPDGVNWSDIAGSKNKDTITRIFNVQPLHYRVAATCSHTNDTDYTAPHKVNIKPGYKCYCYSQSVGEYDDTSDIGSFKIAKFEVSDKGTHLLNPKALRERTDYTDLPPIEIDVDSVYNFYVFHTMPYNNHADAKVTVFVDFDNDKQYDIPEERIYTGFTSIGNHVKLGTLMIPNNVIVNVPTGLRIIINNDVAPNIPSDEACGTYESGETEDFIVLFSRPFGVGVKDPEGVNELSLLPNPTTGRFQLQFKGAAAADGVSVRVMNVTGQQVHQQAFQHNGGIFRQQLDLSNQPKGVYLVEVSSNGQKMLQRITVQ